MPTTAQDNYQLLIDKLRDFKKKFYLNEILKGSIYFSAVLLVSYLLVANMEYFGRFDTVTRTCMFYGYIALNTFILGRFIVMPMLSLYGLRKSLTPTQAAGIIGQHFSDVKDKLLNTLQLHEQAQQQTDTFSRDLIEASIAQKTSDLRPVPFVKAVDYSRNRKYLKYTLIPLVLLLGLMLWAPSVLKEGTTRLMAYDKYFEKEAPFQFILMNDSLKGIRQQDYTVDVKVTGQELPAEVSLLVDGLPYKMAGKSKIEFNYVLKNLQKDVKLQFSANGFTSRPYELRVLPKPVLQKFDVELNYPAYIGKREETLHNVGDLTIPAGTVVTWKFYTENTDAIKLAFNDKAFQAEHSAENAYTFRSRFMQDEHYYLKTSNRFLSNNDSIEYQVNVVPDAFPGIKVSQEQDSVHAKNMYFSGEISDDYGFTRLDFKYRYTKSDDSAKMHSVTKTKAIAINDHKLLQPFFQYWDLSEINIKPGDELEYYFEVWDNDGVNGAKAARSQKLYFKAPSEKELQASAEANSQELQNKMSSAVQQASELQKEMQKTRMDLINKKSLEWQDKKRINDMLDKQKNLEDMVKDIQQQYNKNIQQKNEFQQMDKELMDKHQKLQEMFDKIMDPETKKMLEELQKMLEQNNKDQIQKELDQMKMDDKEVQKELDRMMDLYKQLEFEQKLDETISKLDKLADKQDKLSQESEQKKDKGQDNKELQEKQKDLEEQFKDVQKDLNDLEKKNEELERKNEMQKTDEEQKDIQNEMQKSEQNLENQQNQKASQSQKNASKKMGQMSKKLKEMQASMQKKAHEEDYQALRQLLENLVYVSMEQEKLMDDFRAVNQYNPQYVELSQKQRRLKEDAGMIEDSLQALSKRVMELQSFVSKEIGEVNFNMANAIDALSDRNTAKARSHQQFAMTSLNNLALMLSEALEQMQQNMKASQQKCNGPNCKNPNKSGPSMSKMKEMQEQLSKQLEEMKKAQQEGKDGKENKQGRQQLSKQLAEMAAKQEAIRREIQRINEELNKSGNKPLGDLDKMQEEMDKNEEDIVNRRITEETLRRQHDIMTRMLESEKAERQQEEDNERKAVQAKEHPSATPPQLEKYLKQKEKEVEMLRNVPPALNAYYREKVKTYFQDLK